MFESLIFWSCVMTKSHFSEKYLCSSPKELFEESISQDVEIINLVADGHRNCIGNKEEGLWLLMNNEELLERYVSANSMNLQTLVDCIMSELELFYANEEKEWHNTKKELVMLHLNQGTALDHEIASYMLKYVQKDELFFEKILNSYFNNAEIVLESLLKVKDRDFVNKYLKNCIGSSYAEISKKYREYDIKSIEYPADYDAVKMFLQRSISNCDEEESVLSCEQAEYYIKWIEENEERDFSRLK